MSNFIQLTTKDNDGNYYCIEVNADNILYMHKDMHEGEPVTRIILYGDTLRIVKESIEEIKRKIAESKKSD